MVCFGFNPIWHRAACSLTCELNLVLVTTCCEPATASKVINDFCLFQLFSFATFLTIHLFILTFHKLALTVDLLQLKLKKISITNAIHLLCHIFGFMTRVLNSSAAAATVSHATSFAYDRLCRFLQPSHWTELRKSNAVNSIWSKTKKIESSSFWSDGTSKQQDKRQQMLMRMLPYRNMPNKQPDRN